MKLILKVEDGEDQCLCTVVGLGQYGVWGATTRHSRAGGLLIARGVGAKMTLVKFRP